MANVDGYLSNFIKTDEFEIFDEDVIAKILTEADVQVTKLENENRSFEQMTMEVEFRGMRRKLGLNKTNTGNLKEKFGSESKAWIGKMINIRKIWTTFGRKKVAGLEVKPA